MVRSRRDVDEGGIFRATVCHFSAQCKSVSMLKTSAMAFLREQLPLARGRGIAVAFDMNGV